MAMVAGRREGAAGRTRGHGLAGLFATIAAAIVIADLIATAVLLDDVLKGSASHRAHQWFGLTAGLAAIFLIALLVWYIRRTALQIDAKAGQPAPPVQGILIGADNRLSTSKLSAFAWTWVIAWALLSLAFANWVGAHAGWNAFLKQGLKEEYLVLLGGPFVALVGAKALVGNGVANGTQIKAPADETETTPAHRVAQAFSDDTGQTDLIDTQYLVFGAIALLVFIVSFVQAPNKGLPAVPETLIGLASLGATAYVAKKWTNRDAPPVLESVVPARAKRGATIVLYGTNLLTVSMGGKRVAASERLRVLFGTVAEQEVDPAAPGAQSSPSGADYIRLRVPYVRDADFDAQGRCAVDLLVRNAIGVVSTNPLDFSIER